MTSAQLLEIRRRLAAGEQNLDYATVLELLREVDKLASACEHLRKVTAVQEADFNKQKLELAERIKFLEGVNFNLRSSDVHRKYVRLKEKLEQIFQDGEFVDDEEF